MNNLQPIYLHREFKDIVAKVSSVLLPSLKEADPEITAVHYQFGHPLEIINTLTQFDQGTTTPYKKYPLVAFFLDSSIERGREVGVYGEQTVNMAIIRMCKDSNETAEERDLFNFIPVLTPIYLELMKQITYRADLFVGASSEALIEHKMTNRYYWGKTGLWGNEKNIFNDRVDAIEINNMKLKISSTYCPKPAI